MEEVQAVLKNLELEVEDLRHPSQAEVARCVKTLRNMKVCVDTLAADFLEKEEKRHANRDDNSNSYDRLYEAVRQVEARYLDAHKTLKQSIRVLRSGREHGLLPGVPLPFIPAMVSSSGW